MRLRRVSVEACHAKASVAVARLRSALLLLILFGSCEIQALHARADSFNDYFAARDGTPRCYGRIYDRAHLKSHPAQQITRIVLEVQTGREDGKPPGEDGFEVGISVWRRDLQDWYGGYGYCKAQTPAFFRCYLEGDSGHLHLTPLPEGRLKVQTERLVFEGLNDFFTIENGGFMIESPDGVVSGKSDDADFLLTPLRPEECRALER